MRSYLLVFFKNVAVVMKQSHTHTYPEKVLAPLHPSTTQTFLAHECRTRKESTGVALKDRPSAGSLVPGGRQVTLHGRKEPGEKAPSEGTMAI